ncbi:interferon gamma-like isoform 2-T2 [Pholidichthys leucotaenia]
MAMRRTVVCLALWLLICQVRGSYITLTMNKTIQNLLQRYTSQDNYNGRPVFSRELLAGKAETKMVFMSGVLETYDKLIRHMLNQMPTSSPQTTGSEDTSAPISTSTSSSVREDLNYILKMVQTLRRKHDYQEQEKLLQGLQNLKDIQMDNLVVQEKALLELPWLYEEASSLLDNKMQRRRRRRRQAKRKTHTKA